MMPCADEGSKAALVFDFDSADPAVGALSSAACFSRVASGCGYISHSSTTHQQTTGICAVYYPPPARVATV